jgi:type IV pilus assembly protein PilC
MAVYVWKGKNRYGDSVGGERVASSPDDLARLLQKEQITIGSIAPKRIGFGLSFLRREKVKLKELAIYSRQLSVLIDAELPLIQSLTILAEQTKNKYFKRVITTIREDVEAGASLNQAKRKFPKAFDDLYCNLIASGEQSGSLDTMLQRLSEYIEKNVKLRSQVRGAMVYPSAILIFSIIVAVFMLWKVIPIFAGIFEELGARLPFLTQFVINMSHFVANYFIYIVLGIVGLVFGFRFIRRTEQGRWTTDKLILRVPLFGKLMSKVAMTRITRTLSTLLGGGVSMLESLKITATTAGNKIIEKGVLDARRHVTEGRSLTDAFKDTGQFPFMMT